MILVDTSVWVDYLRDGDHPSVDVLEGLIQEGADIRVTEPIVMELLGGLVRRVNAANVEAIANGVPLISAQMNADFRSAADLMVASARNGHPIRSSVDCLIAAVAIRAGAALLHKDRDFGYLAEIAPLRILHASR